MGVLSVVGLVVLIAVFVLVFCMVVFPAELLCDKFNYHDYSEARINGRGYWETDCKRPGCRSVKQLIDGQWVEKGKKK